MKRRTFCRSALATIATAATSGSVLAAVTEALGPIRDDISAVTGGGQSISLSRVDLEALRRSLRGPLLTHTDAGYDAARKVWNGAFDRRPALIVRCSGASDVIQAVAFARTNNLLVAVRGGGHSNSGQSVCEGGMMIDLSPLKSVRVDPAKQIATAEPGVLLGELDRETQYFGLATPAGTVSHTGIAGLTLGGGVGRLARKYGMSCDNLRSVDIVTAQGELLRASAEQNQDLFWGVRGGGGNFGVVTSFEYRMHKVGPRLIGGKLVYPIEQARDVLGFLAEYSLRASDELFVQTVIARGARDPGFVSVDVCHCGSTAAAERELAPLLRFGRPISNTVSLRPYVELQRADDDKSRHGRCYYTKSGFMERLEPALIALTLERIQAATAPPVSAVFFDMGGAVSRVKPTDTAFVQRQARYMLLLQSVWDDRAEADARISWMRETWRELEPHTNGFYVNTNTVDRSVNQIQENYGVNFKRLLAVKRKYDANNLFRLNANIAPSA